MNRILFLSADFLSRPPGFYVMLLAMLLCTLLVPFGLTNTITYALSVAAIVITGVVLIQGYRDTAAIHAKLDEIVLSLEKARNDVIGLEQAQPEEIKAKLKKLEREASNDLIEPEAAAKNQVLTDAANPTGSARAGQVETSLTKRQVDKHKLERADREARTLLDDEREAREKKTARLRELRLRQEAETAPPPKPKAGNRKH
jgi:low affinity Fe/Cu permease